MKKLRLALVGAGNIANVHLKSYKNNDRVELDAAHVCVWNCAHAKSTIKALNAGFNLPCEKPMAMSAKEAEETKEAATPVVGSLINPVQAALSLISVFILLTLNAKKFSAISMKRTK